ncbi:PEP-CTERM sorting domain-containing protein [Aquabacterium sp.]|uniref:PEP-CTERM sorting domain-containing protein n=1 Tax=Aquabacterium sp. TaxID=1872578 RepID=UPI002601DD16|nr:PEP-CTERM sorting domain-containing protein [Aquabacterium sp.]MDD2977997.1 PEP-CTERM sorting domain-containing protein [Aquabacterium sp.]
MKKTLLSIALVASNLFTASVATAAPVIYNLSLPNISTFDNVITGTGATVSTTQVVTGQSIYNYIDKNGNPATVTVTRPGSNTPTGADQSGYTSWSGTGKSLSGAVWTIDPYSTSGEAIPGFNSGLTFTFSSPVNAFGFEIGDWATCCTSGDRPANVQATYGVPAAGSGLWIAFDGGAATLPANALSDTDNPGFAETGDYTNFIGAIDSSGFFSSVTFFGDGFGEVLVAGGTLRFASVPKDSVGTVSEPATLALIGLSLVGLAVTRRKAA